MKIKCVSKFLFGVCGVRDSLQMFYNSKGEARYYRVRHRDTNKRFYYHQQSKIYADKELLNHRETLSQTPISHSNKGLIDLGHNKGQNGQIESSTILKNSWASSSVRIEHQPPKLGVEGSNPSPPAIDYKSSTGYPFGWSFLYWVSSSAVMQIVFLFSAIAMGRAS
jgi:hypothetical protein